MVGSHTKGLRDTAGMEAMPAIDQPWWRRKPASGFVVGRPSEGQALQEAISRRRTLYMMRMAPK